MFFQKGVVNIEKYLTTYIVPGHIHQRMRHHQQLYLLYIQYPQLLPLVPNNQIIELFKKNKLVKTTR